MSVDPIHLAERLAGDGIINLHYESDLEAFALIIKALRAYGGRGEANPSDKDAARYRFIRENDDFLYSLLEELERCSYVELSLWQQHFDSEIDKRLLYVHE